MHYIVHCEDVRRKTNVVLTRTKYNNIDLTESTSSFEAIVGRFAFELEETAECRAVPAFGVGEVGNRPGRHL